MSQHVMPIRQVRPDLKDAVRMSVAEIERFLAMFYPGSVIREHQSALAIAGQWLSRVKGFHEDDDFLHLVRDFLAWLTSGGKRSPASDHLSLFFSGFMPSYGTARAFVERVNDRAAWPEVRAFMHSQAYGNAKQYIETFDWPGGGQKAQAEAEAWLKVIREEDGKLKAAAMLAGMALPVPKLPETGFPANDPVFPKPPPELKLVPPVEAPAVGAAEETALGRLLGLARSANSWLLGITLFVHSSSLNEGEDEVMAKIHEQYARQKKLAIADPQVKTGVVVDATNTECKAQIENNQKNGVKCENDGYTLMEQELFYKRLVDPPKGRGLDGLFEKQSGTMGAPARMPQFVKQPRPGGELVFIPEAVKPPKPQYDYTNPRSAPVYPKFVVFEAKHISKPFRSTDPDGILKEVRRRLGDTCDGTQMNPDWIAPRIPRALNRSEKQGRMTKMEKDDKFQQTNDNGCASWIFVCLPGPTGSSSKLFVLIDVEASGMKLNRAPQPTPSQPGDNTI